MGSWVLRALDGSLKGQVFALGERTVIGRSGDADIQLLEKGVSRQHACLFIGDHGGMLLMDMSSTNGTRVDERRIGECELRVGDTIAIGQSLLRYEAPTNSDDLGGRDEDLKVMSGPALGMTANLGPSRQAAMALDMVSQTGSAHVEALEEPIEVEVDADDLTPPPPAMATCGPLHAVAQSSKWNYCPECGATLR